MNQYVTGAVIKELREKYHLTQAELAEKWNVSAKTIFLLSGIFLCCERSNLCKESKISFCGGSYVLRKK